MRKKIVFILIVLITIIIDQVIKIQINANFNGNIVIINNILELSYTKNTGIAYGLGQSSILLIIIINIIIIIGIIKFLGKNFSKLNGALKIASGLVLSGGISNLIDRIFKGYVIDYIDISKLINYPVFNLADIMIVIGIIIVIVKLLIYSVENQENKNETIHNKK